MTNQDLSVYNIADALKLHLYNTSAQDVIIPSIPSFLGKRGGEFKTTITSFVVKQTIINGARLEMDYNRSERMIVPANGTCEIFLAIMTVLKNPVSPTSIQKGNEATILIKDQDPNGPKTLLLPGKYTLTISLILSAKSASGLPYHDYLTLPNTIINYGL